MGFGYESKRLRLVPMDPDKHLENLYLWMNDSEITDTLGFAGTPMTRATERNFIDRMNDDKTHVVWAIELLDGTLARWLTKVKATAPRRQSFAPNTPSMSSVYACSKATSSTEIWPPNA